MKAHSHFNGSGIRFGRIIFTRRYHPPQRTKKDSNPTVAGQWDNNKKEITIFLAGFKKSGYNSDSDTTRQEMTRVFIHETLHGVIDYILASDGIHPKGIEHHWPFENGMEYDSSLS